jgi:hypothetical protein
MSLLVENYARELVLVTDDLLLVERDAVQLLYLVLVVEDLLLVEKDAVELLYLVIVNRGSPSSRK